MQYFENKHVLITGAAGFLGSHLVDAVIQSGATVTGVDNLITGSKWNLSHLENNQKFNFIEADVITAPVSYLPTNSRFDCILHFASPASPPRYQAKPVETYLVNSIATHNLLQFLKETNPEGRFVFAGTSEMYGDPLEHPQKESYWGNVNPNGLRACYDESKRLGETICGVHERDFNLDVRIVRIFNTYGPRMDIDDGRVIPNFIKESLAGEKISIYGDGSQTRSYCYVDDLIAGILALTSGEGLKGKTINMGNPVEFTILETAQKIWQLVHPNKAAEFVYSPLPQDDPLRRQPDISLAKEVLQWQPEVSFEDGLLRTVEYFRANSH